MAARFTNAELQQFRGKTISDLVGPGLKLLFVGINPGLRTAATNTPFAHPGTSSIRLSSRPESCPSFLISPTASATRTGRIIAVPWARDHESRHRSDRDGEGADRERLPRGRGPSEAATSHFGGRESSRSWASARTSKGFRPGARPGHQDELLEGARLWVLTNPSARQSRHDSRDARPCVCGTRSSSGRTLAQRRSDVLHDRLEDAGVEFHAQLIGHRDEHRVGLRAPPHPEPARRRSCRARRCSCARIARVHVPMWPTWSLESACARSPK